MGLVRFGERDVVCPCHGAAGGGEPGVDVAVVGGDAGQRVEGAVDGPGTGVGVDDARGDGGGEFVGVVDVDGTVEDEQV